MKKKQNRQFNNLVSSWIEVYSTFDVQIILADNETKSCIGLQLNNRTFRGRDKRQILFHLPPQLISKCNSEKLLNLFSLYNKSLKLVYIILHVTAK